MYFLSLYLVPLTQHKIKVTMFEVRQSVTGQLIKAGRFFHPTDGVSLYIRETNKSGEMRGIFIADYRDPYMNLTYSAKRGCSSWSSNGLLIVMQNGLLQIANNDRIDLTTVSFERLGLNMNNFFPETYRVFLNSKEVFPLVYSLALTTLKN